MTFMLPSGTVIDTALASADDEFHAREPQLARGILDLKAKLERNSALRERVRNKYRTKNTTGYSLNAFLDFDRAVDIFQHVLIGSEGTLAFIAEAVMNTVPDLPVKYTGPAAVPRLVCGCGFDRSSAAGGSEGAGDHGSRFVALGREQGRSSAVAALAAGRRGGIAGRVSVGRRSANARSWRSLPPKRPADSNCSSRHTLPMSRRNRRCCGRFGLGMFPSVGSVRKSGTTVIIEDVAFPIEAAGRRARTI